MNLPRVVTREEWRAARAELLRKEKAATRARDALNAERRRLPVVKVDKEYVFDGANGKATLLDLFDGHPQLIVYHFMFLPDWDQGCVGCSLQVDSIGHLAHLHARNTSLVLVSRAPFAKLAAFRERMGWTYPWFSSFGSDFNRDFEVTTERGEDSAVSTFLASDGNVYHAYSSFDRGCDHLINTFNYLDITPLGRQEKWEDSPEGWPQTPAYSWWRHHDRYAS